MSQYRLMPNESFILKEVNVAHGGVRANYTDEIILTNLNLICISKGIFGNTKNVFQYPLNQIKKYNGKAQVVRGKLSNGIPALEIYFINGASESFRFQPGKRNQIKKWIEAINSVTCGDNVGQQDTSFENDDGDEDSLVDAFKEVGSQFKDVGTELLDAFGLKLGQKKSPNVNQSQERISKKCVSCSAPLIGYKGQVVKCKYCDTEQTL